MADDVLCSTNVVLKLWLLYQEATCFLFLLLC